MLVVNALSAVRSASNAYVSMHAHVRKFVEAIPIPVGHHMYGYCRCHDLSDPNEPVVADAHYVLSFASHMGLQVITLPKRTPCLHVRTCCSSKHKATLALLKGAAATTSLCSLTN